MNTQPNLHDPDGFYADWVQAHEGLDADQSADLQARLVLLLANQIGDAAVLRQCLNAARAAAPPLQPLQPVQPAAGGRP